MTNPIYPCLWFNGQGKEAAGFYCKVFHHSELLSNNPLVTIFEMEGQQFMCLDGGPQFTINPSISFFVLCETKEEVKDYWDQLSAEGSILMPLDKYPWSEYYGWVQDKYGVSWQLFQGNWKEVGQKFTPLLLFTGAVHGRAAEAIQYYTSIFENSSITGILKYGPGEGEVEGTVKHAQFIIAGQVFMAMDSSLSHNFTFNEAISLVVTCQTQEEIDHYWTKLTDGGEESRCGWLKDKFGVSWQIVPAILGKLMSDPLKAPRVMQAFMKMKKFDIAKLEEA